MISTKMPFFDKNKIMLIFILSLLVQIVYLSLYPLDKPKKDAVVYDTIGLNIANGNGFSIDGVSPTTLYPVYPIVLSIIYRLFGHDYFVVKSFLALLMALTCVIIYMLGEVVFGGKIGLLASLLLAFYPPFLGLSRIMYAEPVLFLFLYSLIFLLVLFLRYMKIRYIFFVGILLGLAILSKPYIIYAPLVVSILILFLLSNKRQAVKSIVILNLAILLAMTPWTIRNYVVFGDFRPISFFAIKAGKINKVDIAVFYNKEKYTHNVLLQQEQMLDDYYKKAKISSSARANKNISQKIVDYLGSDYTGNPSNLFDLFRRLYISSYSDILDLGIPFKALVDDDTLREKYRFIFLTKFIIMAASFLIFILGIIGMIYWVGRSREALVLAAIFLSHTIFFYFWVVLWGQAGIGGRYGIPVLPVLFLFAAGVVMKIFYSVVKPKHRDISL